MCFFHRPATGAADHSVPGAGVQALRERAEPSAAAGRQPQEPHPEAAGPGSSRPLEVGSGCSRERVSVRLFQRLYNLIMQKMPVKHFNLVHLASMEEVSGVAETCVFAILIAGVSSM